MILISMVDQCPQVEPEEHFVAVTFPEYVWEFLEKESNETGLTVSVIVGRIVTRHVRDEIGRCG